MSVSFTGPTSDHTSGKGKFLFIETSTPRKNNERATISYKFPTAVTTGCLTMYYHMYGSHVGTLTVTSRDLSGTVNPLWTKSWTQGDKWLKMAVSIKKQTSVVSVVEVHRNVKCTPNRSINIGA